MITPDVTALRKRFAFPGMRILQFAFGGDSRNAYLPHHHEPDCVVYTGTHDNDTTLGWWARASAHERVHALAYLGMRGPRDALGPDPRRLRVGGRHRDRPAARRPGSGRRTPHEPARPRRGLLGVALRVGAGATRACSAPGSAVRALRALRPHLGAHAWRTTQRAPEGALSTLAVGSEAQFSGTFLPSL